MSGPQSIIDRIESLRAEAEKRASGQPTAVNWQGFDLFWLLDTAASLALRVELDAAGRSGDPAEEPILVSDSPLHKDRSSDPEPAPSPGAQAAEWHRYLHQEGILVEDDGEECGPWHHRVFLRAVPALQATPPDWLRLHAESPEHHDLNTLDDCRAALQATGESSDE